MSKQKVGFNYRSAFKGRQVDYLAALRDSAIFNLYGITVTAFIPKVENNVDEYQNFKDDDFNEFQIMCVPEFTEYRQVLSQFGMSAEDNVDYPLDILIPSALHLPRNTRLVLNEFDSHEHKIDREWRVLSTETKQLSNSKSYTKVAHCVPARTHVIVTAGVYDIDCVSYVEQIFEDMVHVIKVNSQTVTMVCQANVEVDNNPDIPQPELYANITCNANVRVLSPSIYNN